MKSVFEMARTILICTQLRHRVFLVKDSEMQCKMPRCMDESLHILVQQNDRDLHLMLIFLRIEAILSSSVVVKLIVRILSSLLGPFQSPSCHSMRQASLPP